MLQSLYHDRLEEFPDDRNGLNYWKDWNKGLFLACRAIKSAAIAERYALDHAWTDAALFTLAVIDTQAVLKFTGFIIGVAIIGQGRSAPANRIT